MPPLAAAHPRSGGTYEYGYVWLNPTLGFSAGWMFMLAKSASAATAALGLSGYLLDLAGVDRDCKTHHLGRASITRESNRGVHDAELAACLLMRGLRRQLHVVRGVLQQITTAMGFLFVDLAQGR